MKAVSAFTPSAGGRLLQTHGRAPPAADGGVMRRWKQRLADARLLNHLIGGRQQRFRDGEAEGLGGLEVDHELDFGR